MRSWRRRRPPGALDVERLREDFPILQRKVHGKPLVYLDNAATTQKPQAVIERDPAVLHDAQRQHPPRRALPQRARDRAYEEARRKVERFLNAAEPREIVFVRGTTEAINLVAQTLRARPRRARATRC